jgi:hypothetical protein
VIQDASACAAQAHSRLVATVRFPVPPAAGTRGMVLDADTPHLLLEGSTTLTLDEPPHPPARSGKARSSKKTTTV